MSRFSLRGKRPLAATAVAMMAIGAIASYFAITSVGSPVADGVYAENDGANSILVPAPAEAGYIDIQVTRDSSSPTTLVGQQLSFTAGDDMVFEETKDWNDTPGTITSGMVSAAGNDDFGDGTPNTAKFRLNLNGGVLPIGGSLTISVAGVAGNAITMAHP